MKSEAWSLNTVRGGRAGFSLFITYVLIDTSIGSISNLSISKQFTMVASRALSAEILSAHRQLTGMLGAAFPCKCTSFAHRAKFRGRDGRSAFCAMLSRKIRFDSSGVEYSVIVVEVKR